jgi:hypothetical protein
MLNGTTSTALQDILDFLAREWQPLVAFATLVTTIVTYFITRGRELAWKRTEFLFAQSQYIDKDADAWEAIKILEGRHPTVTLEAIFALSSQAEKSTRNEYAQKFDRLLGHIELIAYAVLTVKTLSLREAQSFGWYIQRIVASPLLRDYCSQSGYEDVLRLARALGILSDSHSGDGGAGT